MSFIDRRKQEGWAPSRLAGRDLWALVTSRALCARAGLDPDHWYPVSVPAAAARREAANALAVCAGCLVRTHCLELSLRYWTVGQHGIWGGTVPGERATLRGELIAGQDGDTGDVAAPDGRAVS
jgi:hypothetical protein